MMNNAKSHRRAGLHVGLVRATGAKAARFIARWAPFTVGLVLLLSAGNATILDSARDSGTGSKLDASQLAGEVMQKEINAQVQDQSLWSYREVQEKGGQKKVFEVVQTKAGEIDRLVSLEGTTLDSEQRHAEDERIHKLLTHPALIQREVKKQRDDAQQARTLMKTFRNAFQFEYEGLEGNFIKLRFSPSPNFHPSGHAEQVFHHMEGTLLVDAKEKRLAGIAGRLTTEVKFGDGVLGHLDKGGTFSVKEQDVGSGHWEMTLMDVEMNGRVLFFKTIAVTEKDTYSGFRLTPATATLQQAAELTKAANISEALH